MATTTAIPLLQEIINLKNGNFINIMIVRYDGTATPVTIPAGYAAQDPGGGTAGINAVAVLVAGIGTAPTITSVSGTTLTLAASGTPGDLVVVSRHIGNAAATR